MRDARPVIETERLRLRRWRDADAPLHNAMCRDPDVARFLGPPPAMAASRAVVARQNAILDEYGACFLALERRADGAFLGWCGIRPGPAGTPIADEPEIGWSLRRDAWGQGLAMEAARASLDRFWSTHAAMIVAAITVPANRPSWRLMERLGMVRVAGGAFDHPDLPEGDPLRAHILYRIARPA